jgi:hypothetical protein
MYNDEMFSGEIGQVATQFDGLGHIGTILGTETVYYNGFKQSGSAAPTACRSSASTTSGPSSPAASCSTCSRSRAATC